MNAHIQNISQEPQLVRVKGVKTILKPGEVAEVDESEKSIAKTYKSLFAVVDPASPREIETPAKTEEDGAMDYSKMKQPELRSLCVDRGIGLPGGVMKNADIVTLLEEFDKKAKETPAKTEEDGSTVESEEKSGETGAESIAE